MKQQMKFVNFFNSSLLKGHLINLKKDDENNLTFKKNKGYAGYFSKVFDTEDSDMTFNRLLLDAEFSHCKYEITVFAFNNDIIYLNNDFINVDDYLKSNVSYEEKLDTLKDFTSIRTVNAKDILLYDIKGRYFVVYIGIYTKKESSFKIKGFKVEFPKMSFTDYFPEIYKESGSFFEKFVAIYQSMYLDEEKKIDKIPALLDYETTDDSFVEELASWIGIDNSDKLFSTDQLRYIIKNSELFQGKKGTKEVLSELIELYIGQKPVIAEYFQWYYLMKSNKSLCDLYKKLYGDNKDYFVVIIDAQKIKGEINEQKLKKLISNNIPLGTKFNLIILNKATHTDINCYLGLNSFISTPHTAVTDGMVLGANLTIG